MRTRFSRSMRWLLVSPLLVCAVSLGLVVVTPTNAHASGVAAPIAVSGAARTALTPVCVAGPLGAGICGAAILGPILYSTRGKWMPALKGLFNGGSTEEVEPSASTCTVNVTAFFQPETPRMIVGNLLYAGCTSGSLYVSYQDVTCADSSGQEVTSGVVSNPGNLVNATSPPGGPPGTASFAYTVCGLSLIHI